jgi:ribosome-associated protein
MMELLGLKCKNIEGRDNSSWILVDYGTVIVHVLSREAREFYNLDKLYGAAVEAESEENE